MGKLTLTGTCRSFARTTHASQRLGICYVYLQNSGFEEIPHGGPNSFAREREVQPRDTVLFVIANCNREAKILTLAKYCQRVS